MPQQPRAPLLFAIAVFKLVKCTALVAIAVGAFKLLNDPDAESTARGFLDQLRVDPDNRVANRVLAAISRLTPTRLEEVGAGTLVYALVFAVEGTGLLLRKAWAEYLTLAVTASFIPWEIYECVEKPSLVKGAGILVNALIVAYLALRLRKKRREHQA